MCKILLLKVKLMCKILLLKVKFAAKVQKTFNGANIFNKKIVKRIFFVKTTLFAV